MMSEVADSLAEAMSHSLLSEWIEITINTPSGVATGSHSLLSEWIEIRIARLNPSFSMLSHSLLSEWIEISTTSSVVTVFLSHSLLSEFFYLTYASITKEKSNTRSFYSLKIRT
ncbi:hypothetical protein IGJ55_002367 [Enterococcus sp. AZ170]